MEESSYTIEQLGRRVRDARDDIRNIKRKILLEYMSISALLIYVVSTLPGPRWLTLPLLWLNIAGWVYWIFLAGSLFRRSYPTEHPETELVDEYRKLTYQLARLTRREAVFDILTGCQFILMVIWPLPRIFTRW
jgi:hypothetical protein